MKLRATLNLGAVFVLIAGAAITGLVLTTGQNKTAGGAPAQDGAQSSQGGNRGGGRGGYAPAVTISTAQEAALGKTIDVIGQGRSLKSITITSEVTGLVKEVAFTPGARLTAGDVMILIDDEQQHIALNRAHAQYPVAKENSERYADLAKANAASALEAEAAFNNFKTLEADLRAAQFAVDQRSIKAPFTGIAGLTEIEPGDYIRAGDVIATLDDTSSIVIEFAVPQETASFIEIGQMVSATLASAAGRRYEGAVSAIDSRVNSASRTLRVEATFENTDNRLLPGAVFAVSTTSLGAPAVSVPGLAIQWDRAGAYVWKRGLDGGAVRAHVTILQRTDEIVLVEGEIAPGDEVVSEGADRVRPGIPLGEPQPLRLSPGAGNAISGN